MFFRLIDNINKIISVEMSKSIIDYIQSIFDVAIASAFPDLPLVKSPIIPVQPKMEKFGDYQCNAALPIASIFKEKGEKVAPREIAQKIVANIPENDLIESHNIGGPGFISVFVSKSFLIKQIGEIGAKGVIYEKSSRPLKVVVDYSSPNIAKEMHVGHLRLGLIFEIIDFGSLFVGFKSQKIP